MNRRDFLGSAAVGIGALALVPGSIEAQRLSASIYVTQATLPRGGTERALIAFARGHQARTLRETEDEELARRKWMGSLVINFNAPPGDLEFHALFYDVTDGPAVFINDMSILVNDRSQRTFVQRLQLDRPRFRPNRRLEMVVTVRRAEVGRVRFEIAGQEPQRSGQVDFTEEDTRRRED